MLSPPSLMRIAMKGFTKRHYTTVTLTANDETLDIQVFRLPPNRRAVLFFEMREEFGGGDDWAKDPKAGATFSMVMLGQVLGDQIETKKTEAMSWSEYGEAVAAELEAANLDEKHLEQLMLTDEKVAEEMSGVEDAAGN